MSVVALLGVLPVGCGGSDSRSAPAYTLDDVCARTTPRVCDLRRPCCDATVGFDRATCEVRALRECEADVAAARAGTKTFYPERIEPCFAVFEPLARECRVPAARLPSLLPQLAVCRIFEGRGGEGQSCASDSDCAPSSDPSAFTSCSDATRRCTAVRLLSEGATCELSEGQNALCGAGLYCDVDLAAGAPFQGTCQPATPLGAACDAAAALSLECGLGNYCASGRCAAGKAEGESCSRAGGGLECLSLRCTAGAVCAAPEPLVDSDECGR